MKSSKVLFLIAIVFNFSCVSYKEVPYFQNVRRDSTFKEKINNYSPLTMQPGDILGLVVTSLNHEADLPYNYNITSNMKSLDEIQQSAVVGYLVDQDGNINLPTIGLVKVAGLNTKEIASQLESKLQIYLSKPVVNVRILNFKIAVLGDVKFPGSFTIQNEKITLTQALSLAGDLNTTAVRKNVLLIREKDGNRQYINIDLTSKDVFSSPYYYLKNNDVIYAQPNEAKVQADAGSYQKVGIVISSLSLLVSAFVIYITRK